MARRQNINPPETLVTQPVKSPSTGTPVTRRNQNESTTSRTTTNRVVATPRTTTTTTRTRYTEPASTTPDVPPRVSIGIRTPRNPKNDIQYSNDVLNVAEYEILNEGFELVDKNGISSFRPEIISLTDFMPIYNKEPGVKSFNTIGDYINFQYQAQVLRRDTLVEMLSAIEEWSPNDVDDVTKSLTDQFRNSLQQTQKTVNHYISYINTTEQIKKTLDIKESIKIKKNQEIDLQSFFEKYLQYNKKQFEGFSNTKIYLQLVNDLKAIVENYSFSLLNLIDSDRVNDFNPVDIDNSYTTKDGFTFSIETIQSPINPKNFTQSTNFNSFLNSLPKNNDDRIKLLITVLSKELRVSKNLGDTTIQKTLTEKFGSDPGTGGNGQGNPFDNIFGIVGDTIFDSPIGNNSLASLAYINRNQNIFILPFENKYIDFNSANNKTFIPGTNYLIDSILNVQNTNNTTQFNTKPFLDYASLISEYTNDASSIIKKLFDLDLRRSVIDSEEMFNGILSFIRASTSGLMNEKNADKTQAFTLALVKLSNTDNMLKNMLFQFLCLAGIYSLNPQDEKIIFRQLINELQTTDSLSYIPRIDNKALSLQNNALAYPYLELLAKRISSRIQTLVSKTTNNPLNVSIEQPRRNRRVSTRLTNRINAQTPVATTIQENINTLFVNQNEVEELLLNLVSSKSVASTNIFKAFLDLSNNFSKVASERRQGYLLPDDSGRTRYNFISSSAQLLILYEILLSIVEKYTFNSLVKTTDQNYFGIKISIVDTTMVHTAIEKILHIHDARPRPQNQRIDAPNRTFTTVSRTNNVSIVKDSGIRTTTVRTTDENLNTVSYQVDESDPKYLAFKNSLNTIKIKLSEENDILLKAVDLLNHINKSFIDAQNLVLNAFGQERLNVFLKENTPEDLQIIRNPAQVKLATGIYKHYMDRVSNGIPIETSSGNKFNNIIIADYPRPEEISLLQSMLAQPDYNEPNIDERMKILSIGIPSGFIKQLSNRLNGEQITKTSFVTNKQNDIVSINVYMRDNRYNDIVFKPKKYLFDLSLIKDDVSYKNINPISTDSFDRLIEQISLQDITNPPRNHSVSLKELINDPSYTALNKDELKEMVLNHVQSDLFATYISFISGLNLTEKSFLQNDSIRGQSVNVQLTNIVKRYVTDFLKKDLNRSLTFEEILNDSNIDQEIKDIVRLTIFGSISFEPDVIRDRIIKPKLFDRIFHIPLTVEFFEIDEETTNSTQNGFSALKQDFIQEKLFKYNDRLFLKLNNDEEIIFSDFFVTVETLE